MEVKARTMNAQRWIVEWRGWRVVLAAVLLPMMVTGCGPSYRKLRIEGQRAMLDGSYGAARSLFLQAEDKSPSRVQNLHDLGVCSVYLARQKFTETNRAAAMRELDQAIAYYERAIEVHPGHRASQEGLNIALELKGQFDKALEQAEWVAEFVGPSARQQIFLANELEERGDIDGALLRYRQAVRMEPRNPEAHAAFAEFLNRRNNEKMAIHHWQIAYKLDPSNRKVAQALIARRSLPPIPPSPVERD
jgi:tetratricopeptide (TPR) repeat protein